MEATRIAIGKLVAHTGCHFKVFEEMVHIAFRPEANYSQVTVYEISHSDLRMIKFYNRCGRGFIFLQAVRTDANKLPPTRIYDPKTEYIVMELKHEIKVLIDPMRGSLPSVFIGNEVCSEIERIRLCVAFINDDTVATGTKYASRLHAPSSNKKKRKKSTKPTTSPKHTTSTLEDEITCPICLEIMVYATLLVRLA